LAAAAGHLQLLREEVFVPLSDKQKESVDRAGRSLTAALKLVEDVLNLARAEAIQIEKLTVDIRALVKDMAQATLAQAEMKKLSVSLDLPGEFPAIQTDPTRVRQVLANLISNALKYTSNGGIRMSVAARRRDAREWAVVDVADTGPGIPMDQQPLLFDEFQRLGAWCETSGAGLGLAISQRIARTLGGHITVESEPGHGSVFSLWLPADIDSGTVPSRLAV
jgi:signal transduction histidine kinase